MKGAGRLIAVIMILSMCFPKYAVYADDSSVATLKDKNKDFSMVYDKSPKVSINKIFGADSSEGYTFSAGLNEKPSYVTYKTDGYIIGFSILGYTTGERDDSNEFHRILLSEDGENFVSASDWYTTTNCGPIENNETSWFNYYATKRYTSKSGALEYKYKYLKIEFPAVSSGEGKNVRGSMVGDVSISYLNKESMVSVSEEPAYWDSVSMGGGGMVTGLVFHPKEKGLVYARTDVGGAYRYDSQKGKWIPLFDGFNDEYSNFYGVDGIAVDPSNPDIVYAAAGQYWYNGYDGKSDVLKSTDRGATWKKTELNKFFNGNKKYRSYGECIAVDPADGDTLYCGTRYQGLYVSRDGAGTWARVTDIPMLATSSEEYDSVRYSGIRSVVIDECSDIMNGRCSKAYAAVDGTGVYMTSDGGETWTVMDGSPASVKTLELENGVLYAAASFDYYSGCMGGIFRYKDGVWENITPSQMISNGICTPADIEVITDANGNNILFAANSQHHNIYMKSGNDEWVQVFSQLQLSNTQFRPYMYWRRIGQYADNTQQIAVNPLPEKGGTVEMWVLTGDGIYTQSNPAAEPLAEGMRFNANVNGIEETCVNSVVSTPGGRLFIGIMDYSGYYTDDIFDYSSATIMRKADSVFSGTNKDGYISTTSAFDFCEEDPDYMALFADCTTSGTEYGFVATSENGGTKWKNNGYTPTAGQAMGDVAVSSQLSENGYPVILAAARKTSSEDDVMVMRSEDFGVTWTECSGLPANLITNKYNFSRNIIEADRVKGNVFYIYDYRRGGFYVSEDYGKTFTKTYDIGAQSEGSGTCVRANPAKAGEVFVAANSLGLFRSTDGGKTLSKIGYIDCAESFSFGANVPGTDRPSMYLLGNIYGKRGLYRSDDEGASWVKLNDEQIGLGCGVTCIEGDRKEYGRVYVGTGGRGVMTAGLRQRCPRVVLMSDGEGADFFKNGENLIRIEELTEKNTGNKFITAIYNSENRLKKVCVYEDIEEVSKESFSVDLTGQEDGTYIKCFLWNESDVPMLRCKRYDMKN